MDLEVQFLMHHPYEAEDDDELIFYPNQDPGSSIMPPQFTFTTYKWMDKKIHPVSMQFSGDTSGPRRSTSYTNATYAMPSLI